MKKLGILVLLISTVLAASCGMFGSVKSTPPNTTVPPVSTSQVPVDLKQMANDIQLLKTNYSVLSALISTMQSDSNSTSSDAVKQLQTQVNTLQAKVDSLTLPPVTTAPVGVTQAQLDAQIKTVQDSIAQINQTLTTIQASIVALQNADAALAARISVLEHPPTTTPPPSTAPVQPQITLTPFGSAGNLVITNPAVTEQNLVYSLTLKNTASITQNVLFTLYFIAVPNFPSATDTNSWATGYPRLTTLTGGTLFFSLTQNLTNMVVFQSGVTIQPNTTNTYLINLAVKFKDVGIPASITLYTQVQ